MIIVMVTFLFTSAVIGVILTAYLVFVTLRLWCGLNRHERGLAIFLTAITGLTTAALAANILHLFGA